MAPIVAIGGAASVTAATAAASRPAADSDAIAPPWRNPAHAAIAIAGTTRPGAMTTSIIRHSSAAMARPAVHASKAPLAAAKAAAGEGASTGTNIGVKNTAAAAAMALTVVVRSRARPIISRTKHASAMATARRLPNSIMSASGVSRAVRLATMPASSSRPGQSGGSASAAGARRAIHRRCRRRSRSPTHASCPTQAIAFAAKSAAKSHDDMQVMQGMKVMKDQIERPRHWCAGHEALPLLNSAWPSCPS